MTGCRSERTRPLPNAASRTAAQVIVAAEDGFGGGWDVWDGEGDVSFYGFSVERVVRD